MSSLHGNHHDDYRVKTAYMKPMVADKQPCDQIYIKTNINLFNIVLYNSSIIYTELSTNHTAFSLPLRPAHWPSG